MHGPVAGARTVGGNTTTTHLHSITRRPIRSSSAAAAAAKTEEWDNVASRDCMYALLLFILPTYVSRHSCGLCYCCLSSACVLVPELRVVVLCIRLPRGGRLRVCCCGQMALAAFPRCAGMFTLPVQSRQPRSRCWSRMLPTLKSLGPLKLP